MIIIFFDYFSVLNHGMLKKPDGQPENKYLFLVFGPFDGK